MKKSKSTEEQIAFAMRQAEYAMEPARGIEPPTC
jgi:hypothetical protein